MKITEEKRHEYWNHFVAVLYVYRSRHPNITGPRLKKIKPAIWADEDFWFDIIHRHNGMKQTPEQMAYFDAEVYEHCQGNFWGMICQTLVEEGMLK